jgi:hypothetical protein
MRIRFAVSSLALFLFVGCGGGGGDSSSYSLVSSNSAIESESVEKMHYTDMELGQSYRVFSGDTVVKDSPDAVVELNTDRETGNNLVTLKQGKAHIE